MVLQVISALKAEIQRLEELLTKFNLQLLDKEETDLTKKYGRFAVEMPAFKVLAEEKEAFLMIIRQLCTGEISSVEASTKVSSLLQQLKEAEECIQLPTTSKRPF